MARLRLTHFETEVNLALFPAMPISTVSNGVLSESTVKVEPSLDTGSIDAKRAETLLRMSLEMGAALAPTELFDNFVRSAADLLQARQGFLSLAEGAHYRIVHEHNCELSRTARLALCEGLQRIGLQQHPILHLPANQVLGDDLARELALQDVLCIRLDASNGERLGLLCLMNRMAPITRDAMQILRAVRSHGAIALEHSRLFARMRHAAQQWSELFDSISDLILVHDEESRTVRVNRALAEFASRPAQHVIGLHVSEFLPGIGDRCALCSAPGHQEYTDARTGRAFLVSTSQVHGGLAEGKQTIHALREVTEGRAAERRYRELFDGMQEGAYFSSPDGRFLDVNEALVRMLHYQSKEELMKVDIPTQIYLSPEQRVSSLQLVDLQGSVNNAELTLRRKDGTLIHVIDSCSAVRSPGGEIVQYRGVMLDITEMRRMQGQLKREHDFNRQILRNTQSIIIVADTAGLISYCNRKLPGIEGETSLIGRKLIDLIVPAHAASVSAAMQQALNGELTENIEVPLLLDDRNIGTHSLSLSPMRDDSGAINSLVCVLTDITDAALLQAKLAHTEKMAAVGKLVSGVAHEVNNPLTAILGFADILLQDADTPDAIKPSLQIILSEAHRTKEIVQGLLRFARHNPSRREPVDINEVLRRTISLRSYDCASHQITVIEHFDPAIPRIFADAQQLQQVFLNILNNAYDAVREADRAGEIIITSAHTEHVLEVSISDNGAGIKNVDRVFDPFYTSKEVGKGTGLGLSICYGIVREHGGDISCHNNQSGCGATFSVRLPIGDLV